MQRLLNDLDGIVWTFDAAAAAFTYVSDGSRRLLGYEPREWLDDPGLRTRLLHPEDRQGVLDAFAHATTAGGAFDLTYRLRAADGTWRWLRESAMPGSARSASSRVSTVCSSKPPHPSSPSPRSGSAPSSSVSPRSSTWRRSRRATRPRPLLYVSPQLEPILGFTAGEWLTNRRRHGDRFVADDLERVQQERRRAEAARRTVQHRIPDARARRPTPCGSGTRPCSCATTRTGPLFWQGIMYDVTRQRESEALARETETRYRALVEQLPVIVYSESAVGDELAITTSTRASARSSA